MSRMDSIKEKAMNLNSRFIIAIDGPAASGKGTIAKLLAAKFAMEHFASSIFYRKLASLVLSNEMSFDDAPSIIAISRNPEVINSYETDDLYDDKVTQGASLVASIAEVRANLIVPQRQLIERNKRVVLDGRDIGTVIAPDADLKLFLTASEEVRALRRHNQFLNSGKNYNLADIQRSVHERDSRDQERAIAPLLPARDAIVIDTSHITSEETLAKVMMVIGI